MSNSGVAGVFVCDVGVIVNMSVSVCQFQCVRKSELNMYFTDSPIHRSKLFDSPIHNRLFMYIYCIRVFTMTTVTDEFLYELSGTDKIYRNQSPVVLQCVEDAKVTS